MWDQIVSVPNHCLSFYFVKYLWKCQNSYPSSLIMLFFFIHALIFIIVPLAFHFFCCYFSAVLIVGVPFPFGV